MYGKLQLSDLDWKFKTEKNPHQNNRVGFWPRGKALGGSSSINAMIYVRGDRENFDSWERDGCTGWGYQGVLPYFKKSENCEVPGLDPEYHGKGGPLTIRSPECNPYTHHWVQAATKAGWTFNQDYNGASMHGVSIAQSNISDGIRQNTSRVFLGRHRATRKTLTVATGAHVTRVIFQGTTAIGVEFKRGSADLAAVSKGKTEVVHCSREVILSAGAINTPWLLLLSGVGPKRELEAMGVPVVADLPVGKNLQDHLLLFQCFKTKESGPLSPHMDLYAVGQLFRYLLTKGGLLAHGHLQGTAFATTGLRGDGSTAPDLQIHFYPGSLGAEAVEQANFVDDSFFKDLEKHLGPHAICIVPTLLRPKRYWFVVVVVVVLLLILPFFSSVGEIVLKSRNPFEYPAIHSNYLSDPEGVSPCHPRPVSTITPFSFTV